MQHEFPHRSWQVLLLGGPSGVGKTSVSYRLAHHFGIGITEVDDFQVILERMTTPQEQPVLHYWRTHPEAANLPAEELVRHAIAVGKAMMPALEAVIINHLESQAPIVLEGDFILPDVATAPSLSNSTTRNDVKTLFLYEESEEQYRANFLRREPEMGVQAKRARVSWLYGQWLKEEAERIGLLVIPARPWDALFERILGLIE
jgi:2-phosphoglycerate kinase